MKKMLIDFTGNSLSRNEMQEISGGTSRCSMTCGRVSTSRDCNGSPSYCLNSTPTNQSAGCYYTSCYAIQ